MPLIASRWALTSGVSATFLDCISFLVFMISCELSFFSRWLTCDCTGLKEGKKTPREELSCPYPESRSLYQRRVLGKARQRVKDESPDPGSLLRVRQTPSAFIRAHNEAFAVTVR